MAHPLFTPEAQHLLQTNDGPAMRTFCETLHPATVAETLADSIPVADVWRFLRSTSMEHQAAIFAYFPPEWQVEMVNGSGREQMAKLIEEMSHDDRADLLRRLPKNVQESLLRLVDEADRRDIAKLVQYPENTAGALMTTDYAWLPADITVDEAIDRLRLQAPDSEMIYYIYVVDAQRRLQGVVSLRELIMASRRAVLRDLMETRPVSVRDTDDREHVAHEFQNYDLIAMPVVDVDGRLVGIITSDDVVDAVVEEATEDVHRMGAVGPLEQGYLQTPFLTLWRKRAFWLACLFGAELLTFTALSTFEDAIAEVVVLSLFVPLCISTGGNSGSQAATLITRAMALGEIGNRDWLRVLRHEIAMGLVLGATLGCIGFVRASLTPEGVRSSSPPRHEAFTVTVPASQPLDFKAEPKAWWERWLIYLGLRKDRDDYHVVLPAGALQVIAADKAVRIELAEDEEPPEPEKDAAGNRVYTFPRKCTVRRDPVNLIRLSWVIALSVASICLWGTLMGSMLPLIFRRLGVDPGIASSPFVATFVDVTGIVIYFSIARTILRDVLG
jgi:magnesium transporter